jgi:hypothetical protein
MAVAALVTWESDVESADGYRSGWKVAGFGVVGKKLAKHVLVLAKGNVFGKASKFRPLPDTCKVVHRVSHTHNQTRQSQARKAIAFHVPLALVIHVHSIVELSAGRRRGVKSYCAADYADECSHFSNSMGA